MFEKESYGNGYFISFSIEFTRSCRVNCINSHIFERAKLTPDSKAIEKTHGFFFLHKDRKPAEKLI